MKITILAARGRSTAILLNWLKKNGYADIDLIIERPVPYSKAVYRRARRLGWSTAIGQVFFRTLVVPILAYSSSKREQEILDEKGLDSRFPSIEAIITVDSINDFVVIERLQRREPDVVLVNGTGIIHKSVLDACEAPFINTHVGITPKYRGVHGGYWALWNSDPLNFGVTLHLVDKGVDTGDVLFQTTLVPNPKDNFATYPLIQQAGSFPGLKAALKTLAEHGPLIPISVPEGGTRQWYHPTLLQYLTARFRGVR